MIIKIFYFHQDKIQATFKSTALLQHLHENLTIIRLCQFYKKFGLKIARKSLNCYFFSILKIQIIFIREAVIVIVGSQ